ncbi:hypothetical protein [Lawsonibacter sp. JLR.KK007]|jgi:hypothetical protein|uniref:hypothetical protein n=1 Tax=Lawsonibacter sp. JLR.KK007 TaxID=3114293 RepID=UPI002FF29D28
MEYRNVYFRIDSRYQYDTAWPDDDAKVAFRDETQRLFQNAGWALRLGYNGGCDVVTLDQQDLYLHPMNFSGVVAVENVPKIEAMLAQAKTFRCRGVDFYETYLDLSDEDYWILLESKKDEITAAILDAYRTKRRNLYKVGEVALGIAQRFSVHRLCDKEGHRNKANLYVGQLVEAMIEDGRLITAKTRSGIGIRTAQEKELREKQISLVDKDYLSRLVG